MSLREALLQNDEAQQKTIAQEARAGTLTSERIEEIESEAREWIKLLQSIHETPQ